MVRYTKPRAYSFRFCSTTIITPSNMTVKSPLSEDFYIRLNLQVAGHGKSDLHQKTDCYAKLQKQT